MTALHRSIIKRMLFLLCFAIMLWMVWKAGPVLLWQTLCSMPLTILGCVCIWALGYLLNAVSFRLVLTGICTKQGLKQRVPGFLATLRLTISGYAINYITPFGLLGGEPYRVWALKDTLGAEQSTQGVVLYSMMHIASHFCFWLLSAFVAFYAVSGLSQQNTLGLRELLTLIFMMIVCLGLLLLFWHLYRRGIALRFLRRWVNWPLLNPSLLPSRNFLWALLLELLSRLVNVIEYWLIMQSLGFLQFGYSQALLVVAFSSLLANILFFSPLQMGTREGGIFLSLQYLLAGQLLPVALTLSFATRIREFIWIAIGLAFMKRK